MRPSNCHYLNFEGEIAIVIGRTARNIAYADAGHYIAGYSVAKLTSACTNSSAAPTPAPCFA